MRSIMFCGVSGVGKSTLVTSLSSNLGIPHCDYADYMLEVMGENDKDAIQWLQPNLRRDVISKVQKMLNERGVFSANNKSLLLFENHLTVYMHGNLYYPIIENFANFNLAGICILYAVPDEIIKRRRLDPHRKRISFDVFAIATQQRENSIQAEIFSKHFRIPVIEIENKTDLLPIELATSWVNSINKCHGINKA